MYKSTTHFLIVVLNYRNGVGRKTSLDLLGFVITLLGFLVSLKTKSNSLISRTKVVNGYKLRLG